MYPKPPNYASLSQSILFADSLHGYYCGCGVFLEDKHSFKAHVTNKHDRQFIAHSSHLLSKISGIVYPCKSWTSRQMNIRTVKGPKEQWRHQLKKCNEAGHIKQTKNNKIKQQVIDISQDEEQNIIKTLPENNLPRHLSVCDEELEDNISHLSSPAQSKIQRSKQTSKLLSIQNQRKEVLYFCEQCHESQMQRNCKMWKTHLIKKPQKVKYKGRLQTIEPSHNDPNILLVKNMNGVAQVPKNMIQIFHLLRAKTTHQKAESSFIFHCGCRQKFQVQKDSTIWPISQHMKNIHNSKMPPNSSHIIFQRMVGPNIISRRLLDVTDIDESLGWCCPCLPEVNMTKMELFDHISFEHEGVSLNYVLPKFEKKIK